MIDTTEQNKWLKEWVKDDPDNLGTDLETRTFNALEVEMIMKIYSSKVVKNNVDLHNVSHQRELLFDFVDKIGEDKTINGGNVGRWYVEKYLSNNCG